MRKSDLYRKFLLEQQKTFTGFKEVSSNEKALKANTPLSQYLTGILKKNNISLKNDEYYISKEIFDTFSKDEKLGETGSSLDISEKTDPYTYKSLGDDKYEVMSGPIAAAIGNIFTKKKLSDQKSDQKSGEESPVEDASGNLEYSLGNTGEYNKIKGTKLITRKQGEKAILLTYLIPDNLDAMSIQSRVPPNEFKKVSDPKEISKIAKEWEKLTKKQLKNIPSSDADSTKKSDADSTKKSSNISIPVEEIQKIFIRHAGDNGFTPSETPELLAAMMAVIKKESNWVPKTEKGYGRTNPYRIAAADEYYDKDGNKTKPQHTEKDAFGGFVATFHLTIPQIKALSSSNRDFFNYVYGDGNERTVNGVFIPKAWTYNEAPASDFAFVNKKRPNGIKGQYYRQWVGEDKFGKHMKKAKKAGAPDDSKGYAPVFHNSLSHDLPGPDDGYKYAGHGLNQLTGKANYAKYAEYGMPEIANDPEQLNDPETASKVAAIFLAKGIKKILGISIDENDPKKIQKIFTDKYQDAKVREDEAINAAAGANSGKTRSASGYAAKQTRGGYDEYIAMFTDEDNDQNANIAENKKYKLNERIFKRLIDKLLIESKEDNIKNIQLALLVDETGKWDDKTEKAFPMFVEKNIDNFVKLSNNEVKKEVLLKFKNDAGSLASLILNDKNKKNLDGVGEMMKKYMEMFPDEYKLHVISKGDSENGHYPPGQGVPNEYIKFKYKNYAFALDTKTGKIGQRKSGDEKSDFKFESKNIIENYFNKSRVNENIINNLIKKIKNKEIDIVDKSKKIDIGKFNDIISKSNNTSASNNDSKQASTNNSKQDSTSNSKQDSTKKDTSNSGKSNKISAELADVKILDDSEYQVNEDENGDPIVSAVSKFVELAKNELGQKFSSVARGPRRQSKASFEGPYAIDALIRKADKTIPPGAYYFSNHPAWKDSGFKDKINNAIKKVTQTTGEKNLEPVSKGTYSGYNSALYQNIFKNYETQLSVVQDAGAKGSRLNGKGKDGWMAAVDSWEQIVKDQIARGKESHMTGYAIDIPKTSKDRLKELNKIANKFGIYFDITNVKTESDHFHINLARLTQEDIDNAKSNSSDIMNETKNAILTFRKLIKQKNKLNESTEKFEDFIKDEKTGNEFRAWVNKDHADVAKRINLDPKGSYNNSYIKNAWNELGDEYVKNKKNEDQLSTNGKYVFVPGKEQSDTHKGTGKGGNGVNGNFFKFYKDNVAIAIEKETGIIKQRLRGKGGEFKEVMNESKIKLFEKMIGKKLSLKENFINPAKIVMDLQSSSNIIVPGKDGMGISGSGLSTEEFLTPIEKSQKKYISKSMPSSKTDDKVDKNKKEKAPPNPAEHTFLFEDELPIKFKQLDMSAGAREAEKIMAAVGKTSHNSEDGAKKIVNLVLKPAVERFGSINNALYYNGKSVPLKDAWKYIGTSETGEQRTAWSGHTLNSFITSEHPFFDTNKDLGTLGISYFWPWMIEKRKEVEANPEKYIGQKIMMPFSKEEIDARSDISLKDGVFSLNGRGGVPEGAGLDGFKAKSKKGPVPGAHMNVYSGGKLIGGNLSGTVKSISPNDKLHTIYFIMVEILPNKPDLT